MTAGAYGVRESRVLLVRGRATWPVLRFHVLTVAIGSLCVRQSGSSSLLDRQRRQENNHLEILYEHASHTANDRRTAPKAPFPRLPSARKARLYGGKREFGTLVTHAVMYIDSLLAWDENEETEAPSQLVVPPCQG